MVEVDWFFLVGDLIVFVVFCVNFEYLFEDVEGYVFVEVFGFEDEFDFSCFFGVGVIWIYNVDFM